MLNRMGQRLFFQMPRVENHADSVTPLSLSPKVDTLQSRVLKWTTDSITNSKLFETEVKDIPLEFSSTAEYLGAFRVPLLEEVRAQLHQALEKTITQSKDPAILAVRVTKMVDTKSKNQDPAMRKFNLYLPKRNAVRSSDLILLCRDELPKWDATRGCLMPQMHHNFLLATVIFARENSPIITAAAYLPDGKPILEPSARQSAWFAVLLGMSLIPADRIWKSINKTDSAARVPKMSVTHDVLRIYQQVVPIGIDSLALPQTPEGAGTLQRVEEYCKSRRLNNSQRDALKSALAGLLTTDVKSHVRMVQGPPGTGKTAMLVPLISALGCLQYRTLVSAPTNAAVVEVCKRMMNFFTVESEKEKNLMRQQEMFSAFCSRVGGSHGNRREMRCSPVELCDVILVGSKGKMEVAVKGTSLEKVFLSYRVQRLAAALNPATGWKGCVQSLETFLINAPAQFALKFGETGDLKTPKQKLARNDSFWSFSKECMFKMQAQMEKHFLTLTSELPRCHIDVKTRKAMTSTFELMKRIVDAMPSNAPVMATTWFSTTKPDPLSEIMANVNLSGTQSSDHPKWKFLQVRESLLKALASRAGCKLLATKKNPQGRQPRYEWLRSQCFKKATLVFSTVSAAGSPLMDGATFQCAIIDEASQLVEAESTIVSGKKGLNQLILVGDHKQLPATVISKVAGKHGYGRSLFDRLQSLKHGCRHMLNIQYRMKPEISHFPNSQFYESGVKDGSNVLSHEYGMRLAGALHYGAYAFLNCKLGAEVSQQKGWKNTAEVAVVTSMVKRLGIVCEERHIQHLSVGVISPYAMQVEAVKQSLGHLHRALDVEVKTVDGFQGNERDVIIFTAVRANHNKGIGFVRDERRLNVAITRGRYCLWIVGNAATLSGEGKVWNNLITDAKARNCFYDL